MRREVDDVGERTPESFIGHPERDGAQAGCIHQHTASRQQHELARGRRVPAPLVGRPHGPGRLHVGSDQPVHERRLAHTRRADQRDGPARGGMRPQLLDPEHRDRARDDHRRGRRRPLDRLDVAGVIAFGIVAEIGFREHHDRLGPALEREDELAFQPPQVGTVLERLRDEHRVDVRGDHLRVAGGPVHRVAAHECRVTRQRRRPRRATSRLRPGAPSRRLRADRARSRRARGLRR